MTEPNDPASVVIAEYLRRKDAGEVVDEQQLLQSHPELSEELRRFFQNEDLIAGLATSVPPSQRETLNPANAGDSVPARREPLKELPAEFGRYRVLKILGQGAMGAVYLAHDTALDRNVALKTPKLDATEDRDLVERFEREARAAATLHHRNICPVFDVGGIEGIRYLTMAYIEGKSLASFVSTSKQLTERQVAITVRKLAQALAAAHDAGVVHRDLKPANIMVDKSGEPVIMDFGLARKLESRDSTRLTQVGTIMGSPAYMSPEQVSGNPDAVGPQSDIYSLGVILFELLTGRLPFEGNIAAVIGQIVTAEPPDIDEFRPGVDPRLKAICRRMMAKSTGDRYRSMHEVADALSDVLRNRKTLPKGKSLAGASRSARAADSVVSSSEEREIFRQIAAAGEVASVALPPRQRTRRASAGGQKRSGGAWFHGLPPWQKLTAAGFGGLALLCGVVILFKGGRVEVDDGSTVNITQDGDTTRLEITPAAQPATATGLATQHSGGWTDLFNGRDLAGWVQCADGGPVTNGWVVAEGAIHLPKSNGAGSSSGNRNIMTTGTYDNFELQFEWKIAAGANSGVIYRGDPQAFVSGPEYQVLDDALHRNGRNPETSAASIYDIAAPTGKVLRPVGQWNTARIVARGNHLEHWLNGRKVVEIEVGSKQWDDALGGTPFKDHKQFGNVRKGHIVLQDHSDAVWFRNLRIRDLSADPELRTVSTDLVTPPEYAAVLTGQWVNVMVELTEQADRGARAAGSLLQAKQENGVLELQGHRRLPLYSAAGRNMAVRARLKKLGKFDDGVMSHPALVLRHSPWHDVDKLAFYAVVLDGRDELTLGLAKNQGLESLESVRSSAPLTDAFELVLAVIDDQLTVYVNGRKVMDVRDATLASGYAAFELINSHVRISSCEIMHLDNIRRSSTAFASPSTTPTSAVAFPADAHFTGARALTELNQPGVVNGYPWISTDGLTVYWTRESGGSGSSILQATRPTVHAPFGAPSTVLQGARMASISPDQLEIVCLFDEDGDGAPAELCSARRSRAEDAFPTPRRIESLRSVTRPKGSVFNSNGLSLLILGQENPEQPTTVWHSRRGNVSAAWEQAQRVKIQGELRPDDWVTHPSLDVAGEHLLLSYTEAGARHLEWGAVADRTADPFTFENFRPLLLDGERFVTRGGRYCDATGELFFTRPIEPSPYQEMQLWVARATQSLRPAAASSISTSGSPASRPTSSSAAWTDLFNGRDLTGWESTDTNSQAWCVEGSALLVEGEGRGYLFSEREYSDFELTLEYRLEKGANSGVYLRAPRNATTSREAIEVALIDDASLSEGSQNTSRVRNGALHGLTNPLLTAANPIGQWNTLVIHAQGQALRVDLNGRRVQNIQLDDLLRDNQGHAGLQRTTGRIALQHWEAPRVEFRNIRIRELSPVAVTAPATPPAARASSLPRNTWLDLDPSAATATSWNWGKPLKNPHNKLWANNTLALDNAAVAYNHIQARDISFKASVKFIEGNNMALVVRGEHGKGGLYALFDRPNRDQLYVAFLDTRYSKTLRASDEEFDFEVTAIGNRATIKVNGVTVVECPDVKKMRTGHVETTAYDARGTFKNMQVKILD